MALTDVLLAQDTRPFLGDLNNLLHLLIIGNIQDLHVWASTEDVDDFDYALVGETNLAEYQLFYEPVLSKVLLHIFGAFVADGIVR